MCVCKNKGCSTFSAFERRQRMKKGSAFARVSSSLLREVYRRKQTLLLNSIPPFFKKKKSAVLHNTHTDWPKVQVKFIYTASISVRTANNKWKRFKYVEASLFCVASFYVWRPDKIFHVVKLTFLTLYSSENWKICYAFQSPPKVKKIEICI